MQATPDKSQVIQLVYNAVDEVNQQLRKSRRLAKSPDVVISGSGSALDSLGLVNLVFAVEQQVEQQFQVALVLAEASTPNPEADPFRTLGSLAEHVHLLLEKKQHG
jgi:hypothetical protein